MKDLKQRLQLLIAMIFVSGGLSACAPGFSSSTGSNAAASAAPGGAPTNGANTVPADWSAIEMGGSINGGRFDSAKVVDIDKPAKTLVIRLPFIPGILLGTQASIAIPEIPGASVGLEEAADGSTVLVLRMPLEKVLHGVDFLPIGRLPSGDALPAIPEGELPTLGLSFDRGNRVKGALYLSPTVIGLFVTTKFDPFIRWTVPIRNEARTVTFGYFTTVPAKPGFDGGFFLSIALPADLARAIDDLL